MSIATLILGESGSGKSTSMRHLDPSKTLLIQCVKKPLPFASKHWKLRNKANQTGNVIQTDDSALIETAMRKSKHPVIIIDDFQATMVNALMRRSSENGYQRFQDIGKNAWNIFNAAGDLESHRRVYIMAHTQTDEFGFARMRTVGKMVDSTIVPEGFFTIVLRTKVVDGEYLFSNQTNGQDCCKSPIGLFTAREIENDLSQVDASICGYYDITETIPQTEATEA